MGKSLSIPICGTFQATMVILWPILNKPLTIALKKNEIRKIMSRVAKCDRRLEHGLVGIAGKESEQERKDRLLVRVSALMTEISTIQTAEA